MKTSRGGYQNLLVYKLAVIIFDLTVEFCDRYISKSSRTHDQMVQAARSGKQNIVEGSLEKSAKGNIKLTGVSRASYGELKEDYEDYLRLKKASLWNKDDPRVREIRSTRITDLSNWPNLPNFTKWKQKPESFANLQITLIYLETYLLDQLLRSLEKKFVTEGGYTENLFKKRLNYRNEHPWKK